MTRKTLARRIAEVLLTSQQRSEAPAAPQPEGLRGFLAGCFVARRSKTTAGILSPAASPARTAAHPARIRSSAAIPVTDLMR
jgi:hypothetical protein